MKISFWSPMRGDAGVTTNMACISALAAMGGKGKSILLENHYNLKGLSDILIEPEQKKHIREQGAYYGRNGMEHALKRIYSGEVEEKVVRQSLLPLLFTDMKYLPQSSIVNREVFDYEFNLVYRDLFFALEQLADFVFIDTETNRNLSSNLILNEADLVVVNLTQNPKELEHFFSEYESIQEKSVYLLGNYVPELSWNLTKICHEYHISYNKVGVIPMNMELGAALSKGKLLHFLNLNYRKAGNKEITYFIRYAKRAEAMILRNIHERQEMKKLAKRMGDQALLRA